MNDLHHLFVQNGESIIPLLFLLGILGYAIKTELDKRKDK